LDALIVPVASLFGLVLGITVHEFSHALCADLLGDPTSRRQGRLTLNPIAHFDPLGGLMVLVSMFTGFGFGWGKPVQVNPVYFRIGPRAGLALTSFAGPMSNVVLATLFAAPLRIAGAQGVFLSPTVWLTLVTVVSTNVALTVFNLLPIHPLDGFGVLRNVLGTVRARWAYDVGDLLDRMRTWGPFVFMALIVIDRALPGRGIIWTILGPVHELLMRLILGGRS
jgi:Zn-dependent protease